MRNNFVRASDDQGVGRGRTSFDLANRRYVFGNTQNSATAQLNTSFGSAAANEARLVYTAIRDNRDVESDPFPEAEVFFRDPRNQPLGTVSLGIDRFSQANALDQDLFEFTNNLTLFRGAHTITLGTNNELYRFDNLFIQDFYGSYEFERLDLGGLTVDADGDGEPDLFDADGDPDTAPVTNALSGLDAFRLGLPSRYLFSYAADYAFDDRGRLVLDEDGNPVRTVGADRQPRAAFTAAQVGLYAQDEWNATDRLRLTFGFRVDVPLVPDEPVANPLVAGVTGVRPDGTVVEFEAPFVDEDGTAYSTRNTASGNPLFSPRLGFNYRADGLAGRPLQVRGGTGIFSGRTPFVWVSNQFSNTGADLARLDATLNAAAFDLPTVDTDGDGVPDQGDGVLTADELGFFPGTADPADQPVPGAGNALAPVQTTEINLISPDFKFPQVFRTNVGLDQELGLGFVATVEGIYTQAVNDVVYRNLNLEQTGTSAYGRPLYFNGTVNSNFTNALLLENTSEGYAYSGVVQLQRRAPREGGLGGSFSYTLNRATNVNNGTSSRAISNWQFNENVDVNDPELGTADFEVRHRILGFLSYTARYADRFSSQVGLFLDSQAGEPYSWIYNGDANGDRQRFNDLAFVPENETDVFLQSGNWDLLDAFIESEPGLTPYRGTFAERNTSRAPWQTRLDLEFNQGIGTLSGQQLDLELTLVNVLNFLDDDWGRLRGTAFNNLNLFNFESYISEANVGSTVAGRVVSADDVGKPVVRFDERTVRDAITGDAFNTLDLASRWQLRFGLKYTF